MPDIEISDLSVNYKTSDKTVHALENVEFELEDGESIGIAGESACGKSTLGLTIIRMLQGGEISSGKILFNNDSILDMPKSKFDGKIRWKEISMVFQGAMNSLDPVFTIRQQFDELLKQHGFDDNMEQIIDDAIHAVNLDHSVLDKYPHELSGGMKQRIVIAMALLLKPKFVIADEPTTALDVLIQAQIINLLKSLKKNGMSLMLISHDLAILSEVAEKIGIMYGGKMVEFGSSLEIYSNPKHPYTKGLLDSIPTLRQEKKIEFISGSPPDLSVPQTGCRFFSRCPEAMDKCKTIPPKIKTKSGYVLCWLYE
ncbi:MAG: dipeptide/oligopeptide/nickel ABC transporter ATP-binding protein [Thaumarchaeota archaeon]|nr:dipeptide/oligopeptide/nickel ABC transporter ATP-binding protein [Nitrososphaerota archaeon]|tara:strand:- start:4642 stop:5577 length:936 start_codon:yes stop_codon:yes gene_type:complete